MSEEKRKMSAFEAFQQTQLTYEEAVEKAKKEAGAPKVDRFRTGEDGEYAVRVLPLAPVFDKDGNILPMDRKGYEYAVHQFFLAIKVPNKKGKKPKKISIPVIRTTDPEVGYSVDLIDTYLQIAKELYSEDKELLDKITKSSYEGGIRWSYQHAMMVLDVSSDKERAKGPQIWQCSHSQYKDLNSAIMRLWAEMLPDGQTTCPVTGLTDAYPVKIIRKTEKNNTTYTIEIGRKVLDVKEEEFEKLLELPRIPEQIYRYTRYQMEATVAYLQQYDEDHDMEVCKEPDFIEAIEKLSGELSPEDTSHFDINNADKNEGTEAGVTLESLFTEYDNIVDQGLSEKSEEYLDLREKIRQFIEDNHLDIRLSKSKNNLQMLNEIEEAMDSQPAKPAKKEPEEEAPAAPARRRAPKPKAPEPEPEEDPDDDDNDQESNEEPEEAPAAPAARPRRARPGSRAAEEAESTDSKSESEEAEDSDEEPEEKPVECRRLHSRRLR